MSMWNDNEEPIIAAERRELQTLRAEIERLKAHNTRLKTAMHYINQENPALVSRALEQKP